MVGVSVSSGSHNELSQTGVGVGVDFSQIQGLEAQGQGASLVGFWKGASSYLADGAFSLSSWPFFSTCMWRETDISLPLFIRPPTLYD